MLLTRDPALSAEIPRSARDFGSGLPLRSRPLDASTSLGQNHWPLPRYGHTMFEVGTVTAVERYGRPFVAQNLGLGTPRIHHRLYRQHHAFSQLRALALLAKVRNLRRFVQFRPNAVTYELSYYAEPVGFDVLLNRRSHVPNGVADLNLLDALVQRSLGHYEQLL